jgi:hypothetical protein
MPNNKRLFVVTQWVLRAGMIVNMLTIGVIVLCLACVFIWLILLPLVFDDTARAMGPTLTSELTRLQLAVSLGGLAALTLAQLIFRALRRVVASASVGDPFIEANAVDLVRVAWLLLGVNVIHALNQPMIDRVLSAMPPHAEVHGTITGLLSMLLVIVFAPGWLSVLLIFVLAQIFRRGSDMRAELAETI